MAAEPSQRPDQRTIVRRPGIGVAIDPAKLTAIRSAAMLNRLELAHLSVQTDPDHNQSCEPDCVHGVSRDAIAKIENGDRRRPKIKTLRLLILALNDALGRRGKPSIDIEDLT